MLPPPVCHVRFALSQKSAARHAAFAEARQRPWRFFFIFADEASRRVQ